MTLLILNAENTSSSPPNFRSVPEGIRQCCGGIVPILGLEKLFASASGQFSEKQFPDIQKAAGGRDVVIVDLRQESHGFLDGHAVSWHTTRNWGNADKDDHASNDDEERMVYMLSRQKTAIVAKILKKDEGEGTITEKEDMPFPVQAVCREEMLVKQHGMGYRRFYVTDHTRPSDETIEEFLKFISKLRYGTWLHFHCSAGMGRSTTFMALADIFYNAGQLDFQEIMRRQAIINGYDLLASKPGWKRPHAEARAACVYQFYESQRKS